MENVKVTVIGGGAAGALCAVLLARSGIVVTLLEKNEKTGKKLFITGKGRCNLTADLPPREFLEGVVRGEKFLRSAVWTFTPEDTKKFFEDEGVALVTERGNRVFPASGKSSDVTRALDRALKESGVRVELCTEVKKAEKKGEKFLVTSSDGREFFSDILVVATGGKSYPSTGSTGDGYDLARSFGHSVVKPVPSLVQLLTHEDVSSLNGISLKNVTLSAEVKGGKTLSEFGELRQLPPDDRKVQEKVDALQKFITEHYYTCSDSVLYELGQMYVYDERFRRNIDQAGGEGTAELVKRAIELHCAC